MSENVFLLSENYILFHIIIRESSNLEALLQKMFIINDIIVLVMLRLAFKEYTAIIENLHLVYSILRIYFRACYNKSKENSLFVTPYFVIFIINIVINILLYFRTTKFFQLLVSMSRLIYGKVLFG